MTTSFWDLQNSDVIVFMGSNAAENHPISMKWFLRGKEKGAKVIVIDPRYTRTAAKADIWVPFRSGTDIAVLGGLINYAIQNGKFHREYVVKYTNAPLLVHPDFQFHDGLFSGWDPEKKAYDRSTWGFQTGPDGQPLRDETLEHPQTVFQHIKRIYSEYTPERVSQITGIPVETFLKLAEIITDTGQPGKAAAFVYAMGWTQHTKGVQNIRAATILQLLLGNIGVPGGGIAALRGHANVQGATDLAVLWHDLPGYLGIPNESHKDLATYLEKTTTKDSFWENKPKFMISLLKAWYGEAARPDNDWAFHYIPKVDSRWFSHYDIFQSIYEGTVKGLFVFGQNPAVGSANAGKIPQVMKNLEWLVVVDIFATETADFWHLFGNDPKEVPTEVFFLPAAGPLEKEGSFTNSHRLIQWKHKAIEPLGESRTDGWYAVQLGKRLKALYANSTAKKDEPIRYLVWDYDDPENPNDFDHLKVLKEINGYEVATGKPVSGFGQLKDDGSTACGCWIYSGILVEENGQLVNKADSRKPTPPNRPDGWVEARADGTTDYLHHGWGFCWPANRRVLYNRASADPEGKPWGKVPLVWFDHATGQWKGVDVPDMLPVKPGEVRMGVRFDTPFIMKAGGLGGIWGGTSLVDGPVPVHYEPVESPVQNLLYRQQNIPTARTYQSPYDHYGTPDKYPLVVTTYRLTEHLTSGVMTRNLPWLAEAFAVPFVEISQELAREKGIRNGDLVEVETARGRIRVRALVTARLKPLRLGDRVVHEIGLPIHWAPFSGVAGVQADITNTLTPQAVDANVQIQESKAFLGNIRKVTA
nr:MAG: formate dehydrogenase-N subunit alpha [Bacillota bacterium]